MGNGSRPDTLRITYPSRGPLPPVEGTFLLALNLPTGPMPMVETTGGDMIVLDPRAVVKRHGVLLYSPRQVPLAKHTRDMRRWLLRHPHWGQDGGDAA